MQRSFWVVLVRTEGAVNIGLSARAVKNFGAERLILVQPAAGHLGRTACDFAANARDILENTLIAHSLFDAVRDADIVLGFSRREGHYRKRDLFLNQTPAFLETQAAQRVALVFGNEKNGLNDEELRFADLCIAIETAPEQPSLNLSHAVATALYQLSQNKNAPLAAVKPSGAESCAQEFIRLLDDLDYFKKEERRTLFTPYLQKILSRGLSGEQDASVVKNLLLRMRGIIRRRSGGK